MSVRTRVGPWSVLVRDPDQAAAVLADAGGALGERALGERGLEVRALELRAAGWLHAGWSALGFEVVAPGELAVSVPVQLPDLAATHALGARLGAALRAGDVVVLDGPLGAGKTCLTQGIGAALGVSGRVTSPTFVLAREHRGPLPLVHVDAYRLREAGATDLHDLDLDPEGVVTVVEWGSGLADDLAPSLLRVRLERGGGTGETDEPGRIARVVGWGPRWTVVQRH